MPTSTKPSFADFARSYIQDGLMARWPKHEALAALSPFQGEMISHAFMSGYIAAMMMNTPPEDYAKSLECYRKLQLDMPPTAEEEAQGWRDSFEHYKRLAIRDARVWEVMEDCYKLGWDFCMEVEAKIRFLKQRARRHGPPNHANDADTEQRAWFGDGSLNSSPISGTILGDARVPCGTG